MRIRLLPSALGSPPHQFLSSYRIDDAIAIDAGSLGLLADLEAQRAIRHVFITHTHIDHLATLPLFLENVYDPARSAVTVWGSTAVLETLERDLFNDRLWPDFIALSRATAPFLQLRELHSGVPVEVEGLRLTPVDVNHAVPTHGFLVQDATAAVAISADTGPTEELWHRARTEPHLKAVFLEASFPDAHQALAERTRHLTPAQFAVEKAKLARTVPFHAVHIKASFRPQVVAELGALGDPDVHVARDDRDYAW